MNIDRLKASKSRDLVEEFPLLPLEDDDSYRIAIAILDRLFALDNQRTPAEMNYFRALARIAHEYEMQHEFTDFCAV
jgi:antitoxin component HigA of HigAB toxin-antitoxin module